MQDINLAVCGHAGHGKSTLLGKAVSEFGMVSKKQIEAAKAAAREGKDPSFVFAHLVFRSKKISPTSEAARGITYQTALIRFELGDRRVTAIDTPGQEDYTNNLFIGMFQADGALLLVSAKDGIMPVTEQILRILVGFEIPLLGVSITKMDVKDYSEEVYRSRVKEVKAKLRELGLYKDKIVFFPTSAYQSGRDILDPGEGVESFQHCKWFKGPSFKDFLSGLDFQNIRPEAPLRALVHPTDAYDHVPGIGKAVTAVVESGVLREKDKLVFEPVSTEAGKPITAEVRSVELTRGHIATPGIPIEEARPRQLVGVALGKVSQNKGLREIFNGRGIVMGPLDKRPSTARRMIIEFTIFDEKIKVRVNEEWVLHAHLDHVTITINEILAYRFKKDNEWITGKYEEVSAGDWGRVRVTTNRPIALETAKTLAPLSRIVIRQGTKAVGFGRCVEILPARSPREDDDRSGERKRKGKDSGRKRPPSSGQIRGPELDSTS